MSAGDEKGSVSQDPAEFFKSIGDKVDAVSGLPNGAITEDEGHRPVEEIESLCMSCGENVCLRRASDDAHKTFC